MEAIRFENISKVYKEGNMTFTALDNINMSVNSGEFVAVIGPSGSGKSTFLSIAGALLKPTEGNVYINGVNLAQLKQKELSKIRLTEIGFILQTSNLIPYLTVLDQLLVVKRMLGRIKKEDKQFAVQLLEEVGLGDKLDKYPKELSGGERQRTAIARAFMNDPNIILADEPTASLDSQRAFEIVELISNGVKKRNKAAIMVTHDERLLKYCDKVYRMSDGKLELSEKREVVLS
ncbi:MAG: ABC transporter ATP-binding protein [Bacilli bacterium]|nr:ABC transporter ATP-binding protein [Bacilli bacterium]